MTEKLATDILLPCAALAGLTAIVWCKAVFERLREMQQRRIHPQSLDRPLHVASKLQDTKSMDDFANLFQLPVLFYVLCLALTSSQGETESYVAAAWVFVALRVVHSAIQTTYNRVTHRFAAWATGALWLFGMWAVFAYGRLVA